MDRRRQSERRNPTGRASKQRKQKNESAITSINDLDDTSLGSILDYLSGHFRFVADVNSRFRSVYRQPPDTF